MNRSVFGSRLILLFLLSLLLFINSLEAGTKHGAEIVVQKNDGHQIRGELIAVKKILSFYWMLNLGLTFQSM